ncbi:Spx/MgsR family RNA polymerase-binding regulatory protein [Myxococcaceae bacterium GXIMD 01537]
MSDEVLVLGYAGCGTCKKAWKWLDARGVAYRSRPIVEAPPSVEELRRWVERAGVPVRKWLNTSGQSYRALGKAKVDAASEAQLLEWLAADGKLVKRPVLVTRDAVVVGFQPERYEALFPVRG